MKDSKTLMVKTSIDLPKSEALGFAKTMDHDEAYYIYKVGVNPKARDACRRENWVVCRYSRQGENVKGAYVLWTNLKDLFPVQVEDEILKPQLHNANEHDNRNYPYSKIDARKHFVNRG